MYLRVFIRIILRNRDIRFTLFFGDIFFLILFAILLLTQRLILFFVFGLLLIFSLLRWTFWNIFWGVSIGTAMWLSLFLIETVFLLLILIGIFFSITFYLLLFQFCFGRKNRSFFCIHNGRIGIFLSCTNPLLRYGRLSFLISHPFVMILVFSFEIRNIRKITFVLGFFPSFVITQ